MAYLTPAVPNEPTRMTVERYFGLVEAGVLSHDDRVELLEGVIVAVPLWAHADVVCGALDAGKHVLCEKMMAWDTAGYTRMIETARKNTRILEIGYQRNYNPVYEAAFAGVFRKELLGDIFLTRLTWHRNGNWRRRGEPPSADYDPSRWGYPTFEHLLNWRLYFRYSRGLFAELASHQINIVNQVYGARPIHSVGVPMLPIAVAVSLKAPAAGV